MRTQVVVGVYMSRACHVVFFCHNLSIRHYTPILMYALLNYTPVTNTIRFIAASLWRLVMILMCPFGLLSVPVKILDLTAPHQSRKIFATTPLHKRLPFAYRSSIGELSSLLFSSHGYYCVQYILAYSEIVHTRFCSVSSSEQHFSLAPANHLIGSGYHSGF
jgi:hypothetical protein